MAGSRFEFPAWLRSQRVQVLVFTAIALTAAGAVIASNHQRHPPRTQSPAVAAIEVSSQSKTDKTEKRYLPSPAQWNAITIEPVVAQVFRSEHLTEGKITLNEDRSTPVFSPYAGRVTRLLVKPGDQVVHGQPLFYIEANDMVQAQNDFIAASAAMNKATSRVALTEIIEKQNRTLHESKAGSLRDLQQSQAEVSQARSDLRSTEIALEAARNRLRILGKTDDEIAEFQEKGKISPETPIYAPISGTVVQRKVGPGQYVSYTSTGSVDPVFTIGDLSSVWLVAFIRETEAPKIRLGQPIEFTVLGYPDKAFRANIVYVASALDPGTRRLMVRATIDNTSGVFKPEMFASVVVFTDEGDSTLAVPREAVIFEGTSARVWVVPDGKTVEMRPITTGIIYGRMIQVLQGLEPGEKIVAKGSIFVDRAAGS